jgi:predicted transcriptional regulator
VPKVTFSLDDDTVALLRRVAERRHKPLSFVVRKAIVEYAGREDKLSDAERTRRMDVLRELANASSTRPVEEVERELRDIRRDRNTGWARHTD